jgi:hypothetical protein
VILKIQDLPLPLASKPEVALSLIFGLPGLSIARESEKLRQSKPTQRIYVIKSYLRKGKAGLVYRGGGRTL